ncbi:MAG: zinc ribbon domain-containing protein [Pyrinomonadaceae bacterium]
MPIYEYKCADCGAHFEKIQKASDEPLTVCESCGGNLEKQWSLSGFQFKGAGWYVTDYAKDKGSAKKSEAESTPAKETASKDKSEKKPEVKKETKTD